MFRTFLKNWAVNQAKFSMANIPSVPIGAFVLYLFLFVLKLPYIPAYLGVFVFTTSINYFCNSLLGTKFLKQIKSEESKAN
jgi:hypothetical protein